VREVHYVDSMLDQADNGSLVAWLNSELPDATQLVLRTGFFSLPALQVLADLLEGLLARDGELVAVLGGDLLQCDIRALDTMLDISRQYPESVQIRILAEPVFQNAKTYHVTHSGGRVSAWVGSANFTMGGFGNNLEAAITLNSDDDDPLVAERVRDPTLAAADDPTAALLDEELIDVLERRVRESRFGFGRAALGLSSPLVDHAPQLVEHWDRLAAGGDIQLVVPTGFHDLDLLLDGGLRPGTLTVVASRPGVGRSTLVLNMLTHAAHAHQLPACLFTFEISALEVLLRVISADTGITHRELRSMGLTDANCTALAAGLVKISDDPLYVNEGQAPHLEALCAAVTAATAYDRLAVVAIDPLSSVISRSFADTRHSEVAEVVRRL
jgi:hypothetical protein